MSKGISQIATMAIYVGITITAISGALTVGAPVLENMQDSNSIQQAQNFMHTIDTNVQEVVSEGEGSTRTVQASFDRGELYYENSTSSLVYEIRTGAEVISPQNSLREGNVVLSSSADVKVNETTIDGTNCYLMENNRIRACIKKVGSESSFEPIDTSDLLTHYKFLNDEGSDKEFTGNMTIELNEEANTSYGEGYTTATETGEFLGTGEVKATVSSEYGFTYDVFYRLPTGADFIKVDVENFR